MRMASKEVIAVRRCITALEDALPDLEEANRELVQSMLASLEEVNQQIVQGQVVDWAQVGHRMLLAAELLHFIHMATDVVVKAYG